MDRLSSQRFVSLMSDAGFKAVFRYEANKELLIGLLNFLLPKEAEVEDIVEYSSFHRRLKFYSSRRFGSQLTQGVDYSALKPVYSISILNYALPHEDESQWDTDHFISCYGDMEIRTHELAEPTIITTFVETARFTKTAEECSSELDCLIYWFKHSGELDMTKNQKIQYDSDMMNEWDIAWQKREERREGREEERGIVAKRMKEQNIPVETIALCTGLSVENIENL